MLHLLKRGLAVVAMAVSIVMVISACQAAAKPPEVVITAKEYGFDLPESIGGGVVTLKLSNTGQEPHMAMLFRLNDGVTLDQFESFSINAHANGALNPFAMYPPLRLSGCAFRRTLVNFNPSPDLLGVVDGDTAIRGKQRSELLAQLVRTRIAAEQLFERGAHQDCFCCLGHQIVICVGEINEWQSVP